MKFAHLLAPIQIGPKQAKNRVYMAPHTTLFADPEGYVTDQYIEYIEERARHGVGTISTGMHLVMPNALDFIGAHTAFDERCVPGMARLAEAIHRHGALAVAQLNHTGRQTDSMIGRAPLFAPSPIPCGPIREVPKEMDLDDIAELVVAFGRAAGYAREAGYDGIEVHASTGYLIEQFLSPYSNRRTDSYGGPLENRRRLLAEIVDAVRAAWQGEPMILGIKLTVRQKLVVGLTLEEGCEIARWLDREKGVDFIHVSEGPYEAMALFGNGMHTPLGVMVPETAAVKAQLGRALAIVNRRIKRPEQAEQILAEGKADLVSLARALIADPAFVAKAARGEPERLRPCIACDQECFGRLERQRPISCLQNPAVGREARWGEGRLGQAARSLEMAVVGGGPAGMKVAEVAARRGHRVSLYEASGELGGQVRLAALAPYRQEFGEITAHLAGELERLGVKIHLGRRLAVEDVLALGAEAVVIATGSRAIPPDLPGADGSPPLHSVREVLEGLEVGPHVLLLDLDGHWPGLITAEYLANAGKRVTFATPIPVVGIDVHQKGDLNSALRRLSPLGVRFFPAHAVARMDGRRVTLLHGLSLAEQVVTDVDAVVFAGNSRADNRLYQALKGRVQHLYAIGDCVAPRRATDAIFDGHRVGAMI